MAKIKICFALVLLFLLITECCIFTEDDIFPDQSDEQDSRYTESEIEYFEEIALGTEYGNTDQVIRKWGNDIKIKVNGVPTQKDLDALDKVVSDIDSIIGEKIPISIVEESPNISINFVPTSEFSICEAAPGNYGYFNCMWENNLIYKCDICIATDIYQEERSHMIREEVTQSLGLMNDSEKYRNSIFFQGYSATQKYVEIDRKLIEMLYIDEIKPGMRKKEVESILRDIS